MNQGKKSEQGAGMWAIVPGLVCVAFLLKIASGLFGGPMARWIYLENEFKADLLYLFLAGAITAFAFFWKSRDEKKTTA